MKAIPRLTNGQDKIIKIRVAEEIHKQMESYLTQYDAMWLWAVARKLGWGKKRLTDLYKAFYALREEDKNFYEANGYENLLESVAYKELLRMGVDVEELHKQFGESVVRTVIHK